MNYKLTTKQEEYNKLENEIVNEKQQFQLDLVTLNNESKGYQNKVIIELSR